MLVRTTILKVADEVEKKIFGVRSFWANLNQFEIEESWEDAY